MIISIRVTTITAGLLGICVGTYFGAIGAVQIAKKWPKNDLFEPTPSFTAPSPLHLGKLGTGENVLCDKHDKAWALQSYDDNGSEISRAWTGTQELIQIVKPFRVQEESEHLNERESTILITPAEQEKCI